MPFSLEFCVCHAALPVFWRGSDSKLSKPFFKEGTKPGKVHAPQVPNVHLMHKGMNSFSALGGKWKLQYFQIFQTPRFIMDVCVHVFL